MSMATSMAPTMAPTMAPPIKRDTHQSTQKISTQLKDIQKTLPLRVLSPDDWAHWTQKGYVIVLRKM